VKAGDSIRPGELANLGRESFRSKENETSL
jgi:hypothetical protein